MYQPNLIKIGAAVFESIAFERHIAFVQKCTYHMSDFFWTHVFEIVTRAHGVFQNYFLINIHKLARCQHLTSISDWFVELWLHKSQS